MSTEHGTPITKKPPMKRKDASFHVAAAGSKAQIEAQRQGAPPEAIDALMDTGPLQVAGLTLKPLCLPVLWAMEAVGSALISEDGKAVGARDVAIAMLCFAEPSETRKLARNGDKDAIEDRAEKLVEDVGLEDIGRINAWMNGQFTRVQKLTGGGDEPDDTKKKSQPPAPPAIPTP